MMVKVFPTDNLLLNDGCQRLIHGRLAEVIRSTDELKNQAQDQFHFGTLPSSPIKKPASGSRERPPSLLSARLRGLAAVAIPTGTFPLEGPRVLRADSPVPLAP